MSPDDLDGLVDAGAFGCLEVVETGADAGDEGADAADLFLGGHGLAQHPVVDVGGSEETLPVSQQVVEVGVQVGQVRDVSAEMVTADAAEPVGAGTASGLALDGSVQTPYGAATSPRAGRACSESSRLLAWRQTRLPRRSKTRVATRSTPLRRSHHRGRYERGGVPQRPLTWAFRSTPPPFCSGADALG